MGLIRFLIYLFIIWLAVRLYKRLTGPPANPRQEPKSKPMQSFVACDYCGLHIPREEAIQHEGRYYCSEAHRDAGRT